MASEGKKIEEEKKGRQVNRTTALFDEWREMRDSRKAVLHAHDDVPNTVFPSLHTWIVTNFQNLNKLIAMGDRSTVDQSTPAAESFVMVIDFFLKWEYDDDNKTIDSVQMKKYIGPEFKTIHKVLTEIRDEEEFKSRHQIDSDKLSDVLRFLDKMSKMETERWGQSQVEQQPWWQSKQEKAEVWTTMKEGTRTPGWYKKVRTYNTIKKQSTYTW